MPSGTAALLDLEETEPGVFRLRCYEEDAGGCGGSNLPACDGTLTVVPAAGTAADHSSR